MSVDQLARLALTIAAAGGKLRDLPEEDMAELPDLGAGFNLGAAWRHELADWAKPRRTQKYLESR